MSRAHLIFAIIGLIPYVVSKHVQFYRKDYTYIEEYDAFYKVHWDENGVTWRSAFNACYEEGAKLFYPSGDEWTIVKNLTDALPKAPNSTEIYVGLHDEFKLGEFITIDGKPTDSPLDIETEDEIPVVDRCMVMNFVTGQFRVYDCSVGLVTPYVCKKADDESCPTIDHGYKYDKNSKKCYKENSIPKTWQEAMKTCYMEGGTLAVLDTATDISEWPKKANQYYFFGVRRMFLSSKFYTVKGNTYGKFNNEYHKNNYPNKHCGVVQFNNNNPNMDVSGCNEYRPFICEMAVN